MKKWYAVIGDPIAQSMSPACMKLGLMKIDIDASYIPIHVTADRLREAVEGLKNLGCQGWNVTVPHKSAIIPFLESVGSFCATNERSEYCPCSRGWHACRLQYRR